MLAFFIFTLGQILGSVSGASLGSVFKPYPGVEVNVNKAGNAKVDVDKAINGLERLFFSVGNKYYTHPTSPIQVVPGGQILYNLGIPGFGLAMYRQEEGHRAPVRYFEAMAITYGMLMWARTFRDDGFIPPSMLSGSWEPRETRKKTWFAASLGFDSTGFESNFTHSSNSSLLLQTPPNITSNSIHLASLGGNHRRSLDESDALALESWKFTGILEQLVVELNFYGSSHAQPIKTVKDFAVDCYASILLKFTIHAVSSGSVQFDWALRCRNLYLSPRGTDHTELTFAEASVLTRAAYIFAVSLVQHSQRWVPTAFVSVYKINAPAGARPIAAGRMGTQY